jgi:hypothetical protein
MAAIRADFSSGRLAWIPVPSPGVGCSMECRTLIFVRPTVATAEERALESWRWRQRRAEARGDLFTEPAPMDEVERKMLVRQSMRRAS